MNNKAFTLVELLAIIAILAIILLIAIPLILNSINNAKISAFKTNAQLIIKAIEFKLADNINFDPTTINKDNIDEILEISNSNYATITVTIIADKINVVVVGSNNWEGLTAYGSMTSIVVVNSDEYSGSIITYNKTFGSSSADWVEDLIYTVDGGYVVLATIDFGDGDIVGPTFGNNDMLLIKYSSTGVEQWAKVYGSSVRDDWKLIQTSDGGYLLYGSTTANNGSITDGNNGQRDYLIIKINTDGTKAWDKTYGGSGDEGLEKIIETSDGYLLVGYTQLTGGDVTAPIHGTSADIWVLKINDSGTPLWNIAYGGSESEYPVDVIQTSDNGFVIASVTSSTNLNGDVTKGTIGGYDIWLLKISSTGTKVWNKTYGTTDNDEILSLLETEDNSLVLIAEVYSDDGDVTDTINGTTDMWFVKMNSLGVIQWDKLYGDNSSLVNLNGIIEEPDGGFTILSNSDEATGDVSISYGNGDIWLFRINSTGTIVWEKTYGGTDYDDSYSFDKTNDGGYIIVGFTYSTDQDITINKGDEDALIIKTTSTGNLSWAKTYGGVNTEEAKFVIPMADGGYMIAADSYTNAPFVSDGDITDGNNGENDLWFLKLNSSGNF